MVQIHRGRVVYAGLINLPRPREMETIGLGRQLPGAASGQVAGFLTVDCVVVSNFATVAAH